MGLNSSSGSCPSVCLLRSHPRSGEMMTAELDFEPEGKVVKPLGFGSGIQAEG